MTLQELLKAQGLTDEQITAVVTEMAKNKIYTAGEENLDIRYAKLKRDHDDLVTRHGEASKLIEELKAGTQANEALQGRITNYESTIAQLQAELKQAQIDAAVQVALLGAKATDVDYMTFRLKEKGDLELDDQGHIKGIDDRLAGLKTQFPTFFESATNQREVQPHKLPERKEGDTGMTRTELLRKSYAERVAFANENPEAYNTIMNQN